MPTFIAGEDLRVGDPVYIKDDGTLAKFTAGSIRIRDPWWRRVLGSLKIARPRFRSPLGLVYADISKGKQGKVIIADYTGQLKGDLPNDR